MVVSIFFLAVSIIQLNNSFKAESCKGKSLTGRSGSDFQDIEESHYRVLNEDSIINKTCNHNPSMVYYEYGSNGLWAEKETEK